MVLEYWCLRVVSALITDDKWLERLLELYIHCEVYEEITRILDGYWNFIDNDKLMFFFFKFKGRVVVSYCTTVTILAQLLDKQ